MSKWVALAGVAAALAVLWAPYFYREWTRQGPSVIEASEDAAVDDLQASEADQTPTVMAALQALGSDDDPAADPDPINGPSADGEGATDGADGVAPAPAVEEGLDADRRDHAEDDHAEDDKAAHRGVHEEGAHEEGVHDGEGTAPGSAAVGDAGAAEGDGSADDAGAVAERPAPPPPPATIRLPQAGPLPAVKAVFDEETRDGLWATEQEGLLPGTLRTMGFSADAVSAVTCHRTVCRVQLDMLDADNAALNALAVKLSESGGPGLVTSKSELVDGRARMMLYVVRDGYSLSDLSRP